MDRGVWEATVHGLARVGHDLATKLPPPYLHPTKGWRIQRERTLGLTGRRSEQDGKEKRKPKTNPPPPKTPSDLTNMVALGGRV